MCMCVHIRHCSQSCCASASLQLSTTTGCRPAPRAARGGFVGAMLAAIVIFTMARDRSLRATGRGAVSGFFAIGGIVLNVISLYQLTVEKGAFETWQATIGGVTADRRLQLLLI